jgi:hypothetical protein
MKSNLGSYDKVIRLVIATIVGVLYFTKVISGTLAVVLGIVAIVFALTAFINFCPLYKILGISTKTKK